MRFEYSIRLFGKIVCHFLTLCFFPLNFRTPYTTLNSSLEWYASYSMFYSPFLSAINLVLLFFDGITIIMLILSL